jgi:uncharacterized protein
VTWIATLLSVALVAYNNVLNRWDWFRGAAYVPINLAFAGATVVAAAASFDLSPADLGFRGDIADGLVALACVVTVAIAALVIAASPHATRISDRRLAHLNGRGLAYHVLVRIPLGTAAVEEVLFRGVLFAAWRTVGSPIVAASCAAVAFGLWHIAPTVATVRINDKGAPAPRVRRAVAGAVVFATVAGFALTWLRLETDGLVAPIVLHAGINSTGAVAAVVASRRAYRTTGHGNPLK